MDTNKIFEMVMDKYQDKDPDQVLAIVEKFRMGLVTIEDKALNRIPEKVIDAEYTQVKAIEGALPPDPSQRMAELKAKYRRKWKKTPKDCIQEENIFCAICGKKLDSLTKTHIAQHDNMTPAEYKELCGYDKKTPLMSNKTLAKARERMKKGGEVYEARQKSLAEKNPPKTEEAAQDS